MAEVLLAVAHGARGASKLAVIKRLRDDLPHLRGTAPGGSSLASMLFEEARLSLRFNHPSIVHTYEVGDEGTPHIVMEYIEGQSLYAVRQRLRRGGSRLPTAMSVRVMCEVLSALHYAHELCDYDGTPLGIVHRDVSPQNIMISYRGGVKLCDFGIAKAASSSIHTEVGALKGKVRYMAPEQAASREVDRRADVYAAGVVLWEALTGRPLLQSDSPAGHLVALVNGGPMPRARSVEPSIDERLDETLARALEREPRDRFPTALAMREALESYLSAVGERVTPESIGEFVANLFADVRAKTSQYIHEYLVASESWSANGALPPIGQLDSGDGSEPRGPNSIAPASLPPPPSVALTSVSRSVAPIAPDAPPPEPRRSMRRAFGQFAIIGALVAASMIVGLGYGIKLRSGGSAGLPSWLETHPTTTTTTAPVTPTTAPPLAAETPAAHNAPTELASPPASAKLRAAAEAAPPSPPPAEAAPKTPPPPAEAAPKTPPPPAEAAPSAPETRSKPVAVARPAPPPRAPAPAPTARRAAEPSAETPEAATNGFLTLDTYPWTRVSLNGRVLGTTPLVRVPLPPGAHTLTLENPAEGIRRTTTVNVKSGDTSTKRLAFE